MHLKYLLSVLFVAAVLVSGNNQLKAQSSISVGFAMPEYINVGYKWHKEQSGYGVAIGTLPSGDNFLISARAGYLYHFMGSRKHSEIKPWYVNPGFAYNAIKSNTVTDHYLIADLRVGREFSINPSWGALAEVGVFYIFWKETAMNNFNFAFDYKNAINPSINIGVYYRFPKPCNCPKIKKKP
jgi:hypothetical protein